MPPQEENVSLFFTEGSSDKEYRIHLRQSGDGWVVDYQNGRRGSTMASGTKTSSPIDFISAKKIFDKLKNEKMKKGYTPDQSGEIFVATKDEGRVSGLRVQLANSVDIKEVEYLLKDDDYIAQEKHDGERRPIIIEDGQVSGCNRDGLLVTLPESVINSGKKIVSVKNRCEFDAEIMGSRIVIFDVTMYDGEDLRNVSLDDRLLTLQAITPFGNIEIVETAFGEKQKEELLNKCKKDLREGLVFKHRHSVYTQDRPASGGDWLKFKFKESATLIVGDVKKNKRSISVSTQEGTIVGNVTVPPNMDIPEKNKLIEVEYLYFFEGGSLFQPVLKSFRNDKHEADKYSSLKRKNENIKESIKLDKIKPNNSKKP